MLTVSECFTLASLLYLTHQFAVPETPVELYQTHQLAIPGTAIYYTTHQLNYTRHTSLLYQAHRFTIPHTSLLYQRHIYQTHQFTIPNTRIPDTPICCTRHQFTTPKKTVCYTRDTSLLYERHQFNYTGDNHVKHLLCCYLTRWLPNIFYTRMQYIEDAC